MQRPPAAPLLLAAPPSPGCVIHDHGHGHGHAAYGHRYVFHPGYRACHCTAHDGWWCEDGGTWVHFTVRPAHIHLTADVHRVAIDDDGPEPFHHVDAHVKGGDGPGRGKGPPPGRGWRK